MLTVVFSRSNDWPGQFSHGELLHSAHYPEQEDTDPGKERDHPCVRGWQTTSLICARFRQRHDSMPRLRWREVVGIVHAPRQTSLTEFRWFCDTQSSRRRKLLSQDAQKQFLAKEFVSFEFKDLSSEQEEDLFARVQMGVQLSAAEKMRASTGPWQELARLFVDDFPIVYSLMKDRARAKDFQLTLSCFSQIVEVMHPSASDGKPILKTLYTALSKLLNNKGAVDDGLKSHLASVWNTFKDLIEKDPDTFTNDDKYLQGVQTFAPVEMVAVAVLISIYSGTRNHKLLIGDIKAMREAIREAFADIRMNTTVWKFVWDFIENLEVIRGAVNGSTTRREVDQTADTTAGASQLLAAPDPAPAPKQKAAKRPRTAAKTRTPGILPPQPPFTVKTEDMSTGSSLGPRQPKRQRTNPGSRNPTTSAEQSGHSMSLSNSPEAYSSLTAPWIADSEIVDPQYPLVPSHTSESSSALLSSEADLWNAATLPSARSPTGSAFVRSNMRTYQAPMAPMGRAGPGAPVHVIPSPTVSSHPPTRTMPPRPIAHHRVSSTSSTSLSAGPGAFSPRHTLQQLDSEVRSITPPVATSSSALASNRQLVRGPHQAIKPPGPMQKHDPIDLTSDSDGEQERQDLLNSFKVEALAEKRQKVATRPVAPSVRTRFPATNRAK
jgi:hypothetical protein